MAAGNLEHLDRQIDTVLLELGEEARPKPGRAQAADHLALRRHVVDLELEDVLQGHDIGLHPLHLGDLHHAARPVLQPLQVHDQIQRARHLSADGLQRQVVAGHQHHRLDARERVAGAVGVDGRERAVVAGVHRLEHVQRLGATHLADDDPVGPHAQRVPHQLADGDLTLALDVVRARLEPQHVTLVQLQLGGVLDRDDALVVGHRRGQGIQERGLAGAGAARDQDVQLGADAAAEKVHRGLGQRSDPDHVVQVQARLAELADRHERPAQRQRRDDRVHAASVGQASVHHRRGLVDPAADLRHDLVDDAAQVRRIGEVDRHLVQAAGPLHPDVMGAVDHDLRDGVVQQQSLQRPMAEDVVGDRLGDGDPVGVRQAGLLGQMSADGGLDPLTQRRLVDVVRVELGAELADDRHVDAVLDVGERIGRGRCVAQGAAGGESFLEIHHAFLASRRRRPWDSGTATAGR